MCWANCDDPRDIEIKGGAGCEPRPLVYTYFPLLVFPQKGGSFHSTSQEGNEGGARPASLCPHTQYWEYL